jgi:carbon monoxide dehydrogenase subunit G
MQLVNEFVVPRGIDETWAILTDVERIAPAMPGAELTGVQDGKYSGKVKIKVGPVTAAYAGVASFRELDAANHHMVLDATGKESSGRGRAAAVVAADLVADGAETKVTVTTDLTISGPLAQFGRGAIAEVSTRLLNQFVANLKETVLADEEAAPTPALQPDEPAPTPAPQPDGEAGSRAGSSPSDQAGPLPMAADVNESVTDEASTAPAATAPNPQVRPASAPGAEVNLLKVAAWPILKRVLPLIIVVAVIVVLIVWLA